MATEKIQVPIETTYDDKGAREALSDLKKIEDESPEVEVTTDASKAVDGFDDVKTSAEELMARNPWVAEVLSDTAAAKGDIESLQGKLREAGDSADDTGRRMDKMGTTNGPRLAGNQVADLTGPLGDASGAASDFGGVFDGLADISEKVAGKVGIDAEKMAGAISGIGFAVAAAAAVWTIYKEEQEKVKKKQKELLDGQKDINKALKDADLGDAASAFVKTYADALAAADKLGISTKTVVDYITGVSDIAPVAADGMTSFNDSIDLVKIEGARVTFEKSNEALGLQDDRLGDVAGALGTYGGAAGDAADDTDTFADAATRAKEKTDDLNASIDTLKNGLDVKRAAEDFDTTINEAMASVALGVGLTRDEIRGIEDDVIAAAEATGKTPIEIETELKKVAAGDLFAVKSDVESWYAAHAVQIAVQVSADSLAKMKSSLKFPGINFQPFPSGSSAGATTVNVNLPRGARHTDIARAINRSTRRSGRRYGNTVHYARR